MRAEFPPGKGVGYLGDGTQIVARASVCATGISYRRLGLPNEDRFLGAGVYYGAGASEAPLTRNEHVYIVGGGNSAGQATMHFAPHASRVSIVILDESLDTTVSRYLVDRIHSTPNVEVIPRTQVIALNGDEMLQEITLKNLTTGEERKTSAHWLFVCIGGVPQTQWAADVGIVRDEAGLVTGPDLLRTGSGPPTGRSIVTRITSKRACPVCSQPGMYGMAR